MDLLPEKMCWHALCPGKVVYEQSTWKGKGNSSHVVDYLVDTDDSLVTVFDWWNRRQPNSSVVGDSVGGADSPARYGPSRRDLAIATAARERG